MLWILTQDKSILFNVKQVAVNGKTIQGIASSDGLEWNERLGKYDSKERAMEILQEIFMKIEENEGHRVTFTMPAN